MAEDLYPDVSRRTAAVVSSHPLVPPEPHLQRDQPLVRGIGVTSNGYLTRFPDALAWLWNVWNQTKGCQSN